ncbi:hypothetical protein [Quadrisphaera sp. KR29]|uniref:hypothetical protein n=1 Tax=Quadrisphaera sp. KR29 TaxID=3461391 RepID=UPI0040447BA7
MTVPARPTEETAHAGGDGGGTGRRAAPGEPRPRRRAVLAAAGAVVGIVAAGGGAALVLRDRGEEPVQPAPASPSSPAPEAEPSLDASRAAAVTLGVFRDNSPSETEAYAQWLGRAVDVAVVFGARDTWDHIADPRYLLESWRGAPQRLSVGLPMLPVDDESATIEEGAGGEYDDVFRQFGQALVEEGQEDAVLRVGWEFNIAGSRWASDDPQAWIAYFRRIVGALRSVEGQRFAIDWNVNNGPSPIGDPVDYYPGDDVVDFVGVDAYDVAGGVYPVPDGASPELDQRLHERAWEQAIYGGQRGLAFWATFAGEHGKPLSLPEWGLWDKTDGTGGGENPWYVEKMAEFMADPSNGVGYHAYFEHDDQGTHRLMTGFPESAQVFRSIFSS